jgi:hypothetical protein
MSSYLIFGIICSSIIVIFLLWFLVNVYKHNKKNYVLILLGIFSTGFLVYVLGSYIKSDYKREVLSNHIIENQQLPDTTILIIDTMKLYKLDGRYYIFNGRTLLPYVN